MTLLLIIPHAGGAHCQQESGLQSRWTHVTYADEIGEVDETNTTYVTDKLN